MRLTDRKLFGNDAAEDENLATLETYFVHLPEFEQFLSDEPLSICSASKGVGKSALLRFMYGSKRVEGNLAYYVKGASLLRNLEPTEASASQWIGIWKRAFEIFISERLEKDFDPKSSLSESGINLLEKVPGDFWILIDDVDSTYRNQESHNLKISSFFSACRELMMELPKIRIRASVRADVWTSIRRSDESLDKCRQYIVEIDWTASGMRQVMANRVLNFFESHVKDENWRKSISTQSDRKADEDVLSLVLSRTFVWNFEDGHAPNYYILHRLAAGRPRWALDLIRLAARHAQKEFDRNPPPNPKAYPKIQSRHIDSAAKDYSRARVADVVTEHSHQCPQINDVIISFSNAPERMSSNHILDFISKNVTEKINVYIDGSKIPALPKDVAHLLYRINFIEGIDKQERSMRYHYKDYPSLFRSTTIPHTNIIWETRAPFKFSRLHSHRRKWNENTV